MELNWIKERSPRWDAEKVRVIGEAPVGIFDRRYRDLKANERPPGEWWRVEADGKVVGYGWLDVVWGDAEILLAVDESSRKKGVGAFILDQLDREATSRSLNYVYNVVRPTHPSAEQVSAWLVKNGFQASADGSLSRRVTHQTTLPDR